MDYLNIVTAFRSGNDSRGTRFRILKFCLETMQILLRSLFLEHKQYGVRVKYICIYILCARMEEGRGVHKVLVGKPEGKRPLGRTRRRWEDNIKMDLQKVGRGCGDWMELAQDREGGGRL